MRAILGSLLVLGFLAGCSDSSAPPSSTGSKTAPADPKKTAPDATSDDKPLVVDEKAVAVIDAAIKAHGGAQALTRTGTFQRSIKGVQVLFEKDCPFTANSSFQSPNRFKDVVEVDVAEQKLFLTLVVNGEDGWQSTGGATMIMPPEQLKGLTDEMYVWTVQTLAPLKSKDFGVVLLPDGKIGDKPASVVRVNAKGKPELKLYFDKTTNLLGKIERRAMLAGQPMDKEYLLLDPKEYEGAKLPTHVIENENGKKKTDWTITSYKFPAKLETATFDKP